MSTFQSRVEGLTNLTLSATSNPTLDQLSQFLKDGVIDVTSRWSLLRPQDKEEFLRESAASDTQAGIDTNGAEIISVVREGGVANDWRPCKKIAVGQQSRVTDSNSLFYASKYNPAYMCGDNSKISVFPEPGTSPDTYKVYYVNNVPVDKGGAALVHSHTDIGYFADDKVYLVVIYASMKCLQTQMASIYTEKLYNVFNFDDTKSRFREVQDAMEQASGLISEGIPAAGYDAFTFFLREDPEMVTSSINLANNQLQIAAAKIQEINSNSQLFTQELSEINNRYQELKAQYDNAFGIARPPQQGAQ